MARWRALLGRWSPHLPILLIVAGYLVLIAWLPSRSIHGDAYDEILALERGACAPSPKHPLTEPAACLFLRGWHAMGQEGRATRPIQIWNGCWMVLALLGAYLVCLRWTGKSGPASSLTLVLAGAYSTFHFALDPFLFYWPPSIACVTWAAWFVLTPSLLAYAAAAVLGTAATLFNPIVLSGVLPVTLSYLRNAPWRRRPRLHVLRAVGLGLTPCAALVLVQRGNVFVANDNALYGRWRATTLRASWEGARDAIFTPTNHYMSAGGTVALWAPRLIELAQWLLMAAALLAFVFFVLRIRRGALWAGPWWLASLMSGAFIAWWDPNQMYFWLYPIWLAVLGCGAFIGQPDQSRAFPWTRSLPLAGIALAVSSLVAYAWPASTMPSRDQEIADAIGRSVAHPGADAIVCPGFCDPSIEFYAGVATAPLIDFYNLRGTGSTRSRFRAFVVARQSMGGQVYFMTEPDGSVRLPAWVRETGIEMKDEDFLHLTWGELSVPIQGVTLRRLIEVPAEP